MTNSNGRRVFNLCKFFILLCTLSNTISVPDDVYDYCRSVGKRLGKCVPLEDCPLFVHWLKQRPLSKEKVKAVVKYTCFFDLDKPKVCCPLEFINPSDGDGSDNFIHVHSGFPSQSDKRVQKQGFGNRNAKPPGTLGTDAFHFPESESNYYNNAEDSSNRAPVLDHSNKRGSSSFIFSNDGATSTRNNNALKGRQKLSLLPKLEDCGTSVKLSRHLGTFGAYPWIALLIYKNEGTSRKDHICSGTIINSKYILTAAHCLEKDGHPVNMIRVGEYDLYTKIDKGSPFLPNAFFEEYLIESQAPHLFFNPRTGENDIALIRVKGEIKFSSYVQPICLPLLSHYGLSSYHHLFFTKDDTINPQPLLVAGWGRLDLNSTVYRTLQEAAVKITPNEECVENNDNFTPSNRFCVGGNNRNAICLTDSGGSLMLPLRLPASLASGVKKSSSTATTKVFQIGVLSSGPSSNQCQNSIVAEADLLDLPMMDSQNAANANANEHRLVLSRSSFLRTRGAKPDAIPRPSEFTNVLQYLEWILGTIEP